MAFCRIPVHRFAELRLLTSRASMTLRPKISRYFASTCSHPRLLSDSPLATAAAQGRRRWAMLSRDGYYRPGHPSLVADKDANMAAESCTSEGRRVRVTFRCSAPPSISYVYFDFPESSYNPYCDDCISVLGAHGGLVLLELYKSPPCSAEHFVYTPAGTSRPPVLSRLPVPEFPTKPESFPATCFDPPNRRPRLGSGAIGPLRRGENDLLVVHVELWYDRDKSSKMALFCVLRPGMRRWELMEPVPVLSTDYFGHRHPQNVICVGDRFICWIWYCSSFLLCDMADEARPKVCDVGLPPEARRCRYGLDDNHKKFRCMGVAGDSSVRFVSIHPHCCSVEYDEDDPDCCGCGYNDSKECWHPRYVFTIKTWTMNLSMDELKWVEDGEIDAEEIWELPGYEGVPQAIPEWPVVCLDEPNVVCFLVSNYHFTRYVEKQKVWMVQLNITTKKLLSVAQLTNDDYRCAYFHLPAEVLY